RLPLPHSSGTARAPVYTAQQEPVVHPPPAIPPHAFSPTRPSNVRFAKRKLSVQLYRPGLSQTCRPVYSTALRCLLFASRCSFGCNNPRLSPAITLPFPGGAVQRLSVAVAAET